MHSSKIGPDLAANGWDESTGHADERSLVTSRLADLIYEKRKISGIPVYVAPLDDGHAVLMEQGYDTPAKPTSAKRTEEDALKDTVKVMNDLALEYGNINVFNLGRAELGAIVLDASGVDAELAKYDYNMYDYSTSGDLGKSRLAKIKYREEMTADGSRVFVGKTAGIWLMLTDNDISSSDQLGDLMAKIAGGEDSDYKVVSLQKKGLDQILGRQ